MCIKEDLGYFNKDVVLHSFLHGKKFVWFISGEGISWRVIFSGGEIFSEANFCGVFFTGGAFIGDNFLVGNFRRGNFPDTYKNCACGKHLH